MPDQFTILQPVAMTFREIESCAEEIARQFGYDRTQISVSDFARRLGADIRISDDRTMKELAESGSLKVRGLGDFTIILASFTGELRNNFTIGHELGHYFLHSGYPDNVKPIYAPRLGTDRVEQQANRFAAGLLMPRDEFIEMAAELNNSPVRLAGYFRVSPVAAEARLKSLGLVENK